MRSKAGRGLSLDDPDVHGDNITAAARQLFEWLCRVVQPLVATGTPRSARTSELRHVLSIFHWISV
jgi:hypothetical protein